MNSHLVQLELRSRLGTPLAADTLWGHIAWGIRYAHGEPALVAWLDRYASDSPPLVVSDPLPAGFFPRPLLPPSAPAREAPTRDQAARRKSHSKRAWISHAAWPKAAGKLAASAVRDALENAAEPPAACSLTMLHAGVNRLTGGTAQTGGGSLHSSDLKFYKDPVRWDVWTLSPEPAEVVRAWFEAGLSGGYGRDAATGAGDLRVLSTTARTLPPAPGANAAVPLGPAVPRPGDPFLGFFRTAIRCGRVGGTFAIGQTPAGHAQRQKYPVRCLMAGSVLVGQPPPAWIGRLVQPVHRDPAIRHYGLAPLLPCRLDAAVLKDPLLVSERHPEACVA